MAREGVNQPLQETMHQGERERTKKGGNNSSCLFFICFFVHRFHESVDYLTFAHLVLWFCWFGQWVLCSPGVIWHDEYRAMHGLFRKEPLHVPGWWVQRRACSLHHQCSIQIAPSLRDREQGRYATREEEWQLTMVQGFEPVSSHTSEGKTRELSGEANAIAQRFGLTARWNCYSGFNGIEL